MSELRVSIFCFCLFRFFVFFKKKTQKTITRHPTLCVVEWLGGWALCRGFGLSVGIGWVLGCCVWVWVVGCWWWGWVSGDCFLSFFFFEKHKKRNKEKQKMLTRSSTQRQTTQPPDHPQSRQPITPTQPSDPASPKTKTKKLSNKN